jgi:hypothetical protein
MSRYYSRRSCPICSCEITSAGAPFVSHMRKHVRAGLVTEGTDRDGMLTFTRKTSPNLSAALKSILSM